MSTQKTRGFDEQTASLADIREIIESDPDTAFAALTYMASNSILSYSDIFSISKLVTRLCAQLPERRRKVAVLAEYTANSIEAAVQYALLAEGVLADIYQAPFDSLRQEILDPASGLYVFGPDAIVLAPSTKKIHSMPPGKLSEAQIESAILSEISEWKNLWQILSQRGVKHVLQHLFEVPEDEYLGVVERRLPWAPRRFIESLNAKMIEASPDNIGWIDVDHLAARVGRQNWHDPRLYHHGKIGFSHRHLPDYTELLGAAWRGITGHTKKALVLDLDNTLWGGVIGDDGLDGILLGPGTVNGEAYQDFAEYLKGLSLRGVILTVCSKNEADIAREVFDSHPHMPLNYDDFAVFVCNWDDKAKNLRHIAHELNIDSSALVFVDDNPAECDLVRRELPEVAVLNLTGDPADFRRKLDQKRYFSTSVISDADLERSQSYAGRRKALNILESSTDIEGYLTSLEMTGNAFFVEEAHLSRLYQMELKTNQFNLTTRRNDMSTLERMHADPATYQIALELKDKFATHGLTACVTAVHAGDALKVTNWLMSCRIFNRTAEDFMHNHLLELAKKLNVSAIEGEFIPSDKNAVVAGLYERLGFGLVQGTHNNYWRLDLGAASMLRTFISPA